MVGLWLGVLLAQAPSALVLENDRLSVRVHRHQGVFQEEMAVLTQAGRRVVLVSPGSLRTDPGATAPLDGLGWWSFRDARRLGQSLLLTGSGVERVIRLSPDGAEVLVTTRVHGRESARSLVTAYAFRPDGQAAPGAQSYSTGPRTREGLVAEDSIRAPVVWARWNELGAAILLETDQDRPMPLAMLAGSLPGSTLLGAGMAHVALRAGEQWVWSERPARLPDGPIEWRVRILLTSEADQVPVSSLASSRTWPTYREPVHALPQVAPFADYARQALGDQNSGFWSEGEIGAPASRDGKVRLGSSANLVLSAWGKRWWGEHLDQNHLIDQADRMVRLALQSVKDGVPARVFDVQTRQWSSLPAGFDTREAAWTGIWLWHYARDSQNSDLRREARRAAVGIARLLSARLCQTGRLPAVWRGLPEDPSDPTDVAPAVWLFRLVGMEQQALIGMNALLSQAVDRGEFGSRGGPDELARLGWTLGALLADESIGPERAIQNVADRIALLQRVWEPGDEPGVTLRGLVAPSAGSSTAGLAEHAWVAPLMVEAGLRTGRRDLAERGAMMARALLGFMPHPLGMANGLSPTTSSGFRVSGRGGFAPATGFIEDQGAILTGLALLTSRYGGAVRSPQGWVVGLDGCAVDSRGGLVDLLAANPVPYGQARRIRIAGPGSEEVREHDLPALPSIRSIRAIMVQDGVQVIATPTTQDAAPGSGRFVMSGTAWVASWDGRSFQRVLPVLGLSESSVVFEGDAGGASLRSRPFPIHINPNWVRPTWPDRGWTRSDGLRPGAFFSLEHWSTADRGLGVVERHLQGALESPEFIVAQERFSFELHGVPDPRCAVELVLVESGQVLHRFTVQQPEPQRIEVEAREFAGQRVKLRLVDQSRNGWVGVSGVRVAGILIPGD